MLSWFALLCVVVPASPVLAQDADSVPVDRWTPALSMRYPSVRGTAVSPDGSRIAYVVRTPVMDDEHSEYRSQIWVVDADGGEPVQYTRGEQSSSSPAFSPDGRLLAFTSARSGKNQVWIIRLAGGEAEQLTHADPGVSSFRFSPDGTKIAYRMRDPDTAEEKAARKAKRDVILVNQQFKYNHLYVVPVAADAQGRHPATRLTEGTFEVTAFDWAPDGSRIVFAHRADPRLNTASRDGDISIVTVNDDPTVTPLITGGGVEGTPLFSPDGRTVAFTSTGSHPEPVGLADVYVVSAGGGTPHRLAMTPDRSPGLLGWTADGSGVLLSEAVHTTRQVILLPADGSEPQFVTEGEGVYGSVSFDRHTSMMAFTWQDPETPVDVYRSPVHGFDRHRVTDLNRDIPRPAMGRTELLRWRSPDGREIEGLLTYPVDYRAGRVYPLILNVHGGPAGAFSQSFTGNPSVYMLQYFAQEGFAILRPNPRGSTGYGKAFRYANVKDWGFGDLDDLLSGVDEVIRRGVASPDSLALMGWSYGGYMTSFAVTRTNRFKAASMGAGLPDLISMVTTTDIGDYLAAHMGGEFWEDYETYQKHSAIYRIANVTTPTQVIHGARDLRVPFTQGQEFYRALLRRGIPTEMIVYPRTPHGPREPKFVMDVSERILTWFNRYLRSPAATTDGR